MNYTIYGYNKKENEASKRAGSRRRVAYAMLSITVKLVIEN